MTTSDASYIVTEPQLDYQKLFSTSANDAWSLMLARKNFIVILLAVFAALAGLTVLTGGGKMDLDTSGQPTGGPLAVLFLLMNDVCIVLISFYALADSIRTIKPNFRITFGIFWGIFGYSLLVGLAAEVATIFLIIPGIWIGTKLSQAVFVYLLRPGAKPLATSWEITTGRFWPTLGFYVLLAFLGGVGTLVPFYAAFGVMRLLPISSIILVPFVFGIISYMMYFGQLVHARWTESLLVVSDAAKVATYTPAPSPLPVVP